MTGEIYRGLSAMGSSLIGSSCSVVSFVRLGSCVSVATTAVCGGSLLASGRSSITDNSKSKEPAFKLDQEVIFDDTLNEPQLPKYQISRKSEEIRFKAFIRRRCL